MVEASMSVVKEWARNHCPVFVVYGPSGVGKTTLYATLFEDDDYWPVAVIDGDDGERTVAKYAHNKKICTYSGKSNRPQGWSVFKWYAKSFVAARETKCGAIVIEGLTKFRDDEIGKALIANPDNVEGNAMRRAYIAPSTLTQALFSAVSDIQDYRKRNGTGVPIIITLNTKTVGLDADSAEIPNLSANLTQNLMRRADAFVHLQRNPGTASRLITTSSPNNHYRKVRNAEVAKAIADMRNPNLPDLLDKWARVEQEQTEATARWAADDDDPQPDNSDNENTDGTT